MKTISENVNKRHLSWNAMLFVFGLRGQAFQAQHVFKETVENGVKPDTVTFIGLLMTCSHNGLIEESRVLFETMGSVYGISSEMEHVVCMVDMLGRSGYLAEANELVDKYSEVGSPETGSCEALLGACSAQGDVGFGRNLGESLKILEPHEETSYVLLSHLY